MIARTHINLDEHINLNYRGCEDKKSLSGCVEPTFTPQHSLDSKTRGELARLLNVVAYNAPDAPYVPLFHPVAGLLLEAGLNEEEVGNTT